MKDGVEPGDGPRPVGLHAVGSTGSPLSPEGFAVGLRPARRRHLAVLDQRRHRRLHRVRRRRADAAGLPGRAAGALARRDGRVVGRGGQAADRRGRRARDHRADAVDAGLLLGRPGRRALRESYFAMYPGVWRHGDWIEITDRGTAIIYGRTDSTINRGGVRMGTSEIYRAVLAARRDRRRARRRRPARGRGELDAAVRRAARRAPSSTTSSIEADRDAHPRGLLAAPRAQRGPRDRRGAAHAVRQGARGAGQADPDGHAARAGRQPRVAGQPRRRSTCSSNWHPSAEPERMAAMSTMSQAPYPVGYEADFVEQRSRADDVLPLPAGDPAVHRRRSFLGHRRCTSA